MMEKGIVIRSTGSWYQVECKGDILDCRIIGKFRLKGFKLTNPVAVGDEVELERETEKTGIIKKILDRKNYVVRQSPRKKHQLHLLASNIDQALLIVTITEPKLKLGFIDRFLIMTEPYDIPVHIVFNKSDLYNDEDMQIFELLEAIYSDLEYQVHLVSCKDNSGIDKVKNALLDKTSLVAGQSGVGKSTLINRIQSNLTLKTTELSDFSGKGQHTTTFAEMFMLDQGGRIIDTPGIKTLSFNHLEVMDVAHNFRELFEYSKGCKYSDCTHRNEPSCAVKEAIEEGYISSLRYKNYLQITEEIEDQNYWEIHTNM
jgi:ribosome biogenesis GTPase